MPINGGTAFRRASARLAAPLSRGDRMTRLLALLLLFLAAPAAAQTDWAVRPAKATSPCAISASAPASRSPSFESTMPRSARRAAMPPANRQRGHGPARHRRLGPPVPCAAIRRPPMSSGLPAVELAAELLLQELRLSPPCHAGVIHRIRDLPAGVAARRAERRIVHPKLRYRLAGAEAEIAEQTSPWVGRTSPPACGRGGRGEREAAQQPHRWIAS